VDLKSENYIFTVNSRSKLAQTHHLVSLFLYQKIQSKLIEIDILNFIRKLKKRIEINLELFFKLLLRQYFLLALIKSYRYLKLKSNLSSKCLQLLKYFIHYK